MTKELFDALQQEPVEGGANAKMTDDWLIKQAITPGIDKLKKLDRWTPTVAYLLCMSVEFRQFALPSEKVMQFDRMMDEALEKWRTLNNKNNTSIKVVNALYDAMQT